jgi:hypothetical protein
MSRYLDSKSLLKYFINKVYTSSSKYELFNEIGIKKLEDFVLKEPGDLIRSIHGFGWKSIKSFQQQFNPYQLYFGMSYEELVDNYPKIEIKSLLKVSKQAMANHYMSNGSLQLVPAIFNQIGTRELGFLLGRLPNDNKITFIKSMDVFYEAFPTIKKLKTLKNLNSIKSVGKKKSLLIGRVLSNYNKSFKDLISYMKSNDINLLSQIRCSYNLGYFFDKNNIKSVNDLEAFCIRYSLDKIKVLNEEIYPLFERRDMIALLELLSLGAGVEKNIFQTTANTISPKMNNLDEIIDTFVSQYIKKDSYRKMIILKNEKNLTLNDTGEEFGVTRERARQVLKKYGDVFLDLFFHNYKDCESILLDLTVKNREPINSNFTIFKKKYSRLHSDQFYLNFLSSFFPNIAFRNVVRSSENYSHINSFLYNIEGVLSIEQNSREENISILQSIFCEVFPKERSYLENLNLQKGHPILSLSDPRISMDEEGYFYDSKISRTKAVHYILKCLDSSQHIDIFASILLSNQVFKHIKYEDICVLTPGENRYQSTNPSISNSKRINNNIYADLQREENAIMFDFKTFGTVNHFKCEYENWDKIRRLSYELVSQSGHEVSAFEIFDIIKPDFPTLSSKYELVVILRDLKNIKKFGDIKKLEYKHPFRFTMKSFKEDKNTVKSIVIDELKKAGKPLLAKTTIYSAITKKRSYRPEGMPLIPKQSKEIEDLGGGYWGLTGKRKENMQYLLKDISYIEKKIYLGRARAGKGSIRPNLITIEGLMSQVYYDIYVSDINHLSDFLSKSKIIKILPNFKDLNKSEQYVTSLRFSILYNVKSIISMSEKPLSLMDIKYRMTEYLDIKIRGNTIIDPIDRQKRSRYFSDIEKKLDNDPLIEYKNSKYSYIEIDMKQYKDFMDMIYNEMKNKRNPLYLEDILHERDEVQNIDTEEMEHIFLLDDRFNIITNNLISLKEWD